MGRDIYTNENLQLVNDMFKHLCLKQLNYTRTQMQIGSELYTKNDMKRLAMLPQMFLN